jgi:hypothetical protein
MHSLAKERGAVGAVIQRPEELTATRLGGILEAAGVPGYSSIAAVELREAARGPFSEHAFYDVIHGGEPPADAPQQVFLKLSLPDVPASRDMVREEVRFYQAYGKDARLPLVACYDACHEPATGASHLLLRDLSATHGNPPKPLPPTFRRAEAMIDALLRTHVRWWMDPDLGRGVGERWTAKSVDDAVRFTEQHYSRFRNLVGDLWSPKRWAVYEDVRRAWPRLLERLVDQPHLTLIHGDAHVWNCLLPNDPSRHPAYLVDWSTCRVRPPTNDLAYMMALMWFSDVRERWERELLARYHRGLLGAGIDGYTWDAFLRDYRFAIIVHLFTPVLQAVGGIVGPTTWWYSCERICTAYAEWNCEELLGTYP